MTPVGVPATERRSISIVSEQCSHKYCTQSIMHLPTEAESDITVHVHGYSFTFTVIRSRSRLLVHVEYSGSLCTKEACLSIAGSKDTSTEMVYL